MSVHELGHLRYAGQAEVTGHPSASDDERKTPLRAQNAVGYPKNSGREPATGYGTLPDVSAMTHPSRDLEKRRYGANIKLARKEVDMSQTQLAPLVDKTQRHVSDWERGVHKPMPESIERLEDIFHKSVGWFGQSHPEQWQEHDIEC
jgi:ribosome-binding protein aMBF1 (putative translation factor)